MVTVLRTGSFRVVIFSNDHEPAHVHVFGDGEAKINLSDPDGRPELIWAVGMKHADIRKCMRLIEETAKHCWHDGTRFMAELTDKQIEAALARGRAAASSEPRAKSARYDRRLDRVVVELTNGCTFAFPPRLAQGLEEATEDELVEVEVLGAGYGLHWETLDVDFTVPGLISGIFGTRAYMARQAGRATSPAKAAAARANGAKGGRPRKTAST